jgi:hypothetical protein
MAACRELASDLLALTALQKHYWILEKSATPTALLFPWFPIPAKTAKEASTKALFTMIWDYIEARKKHQCRVRIRSICNWARAGAIMISSSSEVVLALIFARVIATGINRTSPRIREILNFRFQNY